MKVSLVYLVCSSCLDQTLSAGIFPSLVEADLQGGLSIEHHEMTSQACSGARLQSCSAHEVILVHTKTRHTLFLADAFHGGNHTLQPPVSGTQQASWRLLVHPQEH